MAMSVIDFLRVLLAFGFVFLALPLFAEGHHLWRGEPVDRDPSEWIPIVLRSFILASFIAETACLVLGSLRFCLPGLLIAGSIAWSARQFFVAHQIRSGLKEEYAQSIWRPLIALLEPEQSSELRSRLHAMRFHRAAISFLSRPLPALLIGLFFAFGRGGIQQLRFDQTESYLRAISLAALTAGRPWPPDGSVAFLAPLVCFSGLDAQAVVRFTGPILAAYFAVLISICVWQVWHSGIASGSTLVLFACGALASTHSSWDLVPGSIAIIYWTAAAAAWPYSRKYAVFAALTGLMIAPTEWMGPAICGLLIVSVRLSAWLATSVRTVGPVLAVPVSVVLLALAVSLCHLQMPSPQQYQYESAARTCKNIMRRFHRNQWLIVSPFQELAFTYGHGWHLELSEFVSRFHPPDVAKGSFSFPYEAPDVFFFVERRPLRLGSQTGPYNVVWRYAPAESDEWAAFLYGDPLGRASLEYQAAELLNAYASSHKNLSVFYEDEDLAVYHLTARRTGT